MTGNKMQVGDLVATSMARGRNVAEKNSIGANVHTVLRDKSGNVKYDMWGENLVTDVGDKIIAKRLFDNATNIVAGMKLGTGTTAVAKNGAGAGMVTYITGSQKALDAAATDATKGAGAGWRTTYVCTWAAGVATNSAIKEVCLTNQTPLANDTSAAADTVARHVFPSALDKQAGDSLEVTWQIDILGAYIQ